MSYRFLKFIHGFAKMWFKLPVYYTKYMEILSFQLMRLPPNDSFFPLHPMEREQGDGEWMTYQITFHMLVLTVFRFFYHNHQRLP